MGSAKSSGRCPMRRGAIMLGVVLVAAAWPLAAPAESPPRRLTWKSGQLVSPGTDVPPAVAAIMAQINDGRLTRALIQIGKLRAPDAVRGALAASVGGHISNLRPKKAIAVAKGYLEKAVAADARDIGSRRLLHEIDFFTSGFPAKGFWPAYTLIPARDRIYQGDFEGGRGAVKDRRPKYATFGAWCLAGILESRPKYKKEYDILVGDVGEALKAWQARLAKFKVRDRRMPAFNRIYRRAREEPWAGLVIPVDSPLYPQILIEHVRGYYWWWRQTGPATARKGFLEFLAELKADYPDKDLTKMYDGEKIAWGEEFLPTSVAKNAPLWAVRQQELRGRVDYIVQWWWNNRQASNGSMGGGWDDDCEVLRRWSITSIICGNKGIETGLRKLINGIWTSGCLLKDTGYFRRKWDVEHSCETSSDSSLILLLDYGDPQQVERFLKTTRTTDTLHTAVNANGHRHFLGINMGGKYVSPPDSDDVDTLYHGRAMRPAALIAWYTGIPRAVKLQHEYALARSEDTVRPGKPGGKPAGVMPACIRFKDDHVDGVNSWLCRRYGGLYEWAGSHNRDMVLAKQLNAWQLTGDDRVLDGYRAELELIRKYMNKKDTGAPAGSEEWAARRMARWPKFATWYRVGTGDKQFDDIVVKDNAYGKYLVTGDPAAMAAAHEADLSHVRYNVPMVTSEVRGTDRVDLHPWSLLQALTGSSVSITEPPTFHVTWRHVDGKFAALVRNDFGPSGGSIWVYKFGRRRATPEVRFWRLEAGVYDVSLSADADNDGRPDGPALETQRVEVLRRLDSVRFTLPAKKTFLLQVSRVKKIPPLPKRMADLAIAPRDLTLAAGRGLVVGKSYKGSVVIHNIGSADASGIKVRFSTTSGGSDGAKEFFKTTHGKLAHPADLIAKTTKVEFTWTPKASGRYRLRAEILTNDGAPEIYLKNNAAEIKVVVAGGDFASLSTETRPKKKLLQYGYGVPRPQFLLDNIARMEKRPFDGVIFRLKRYGNVFDTTPWPKDNIKNQAATLAAVKWKKFTDNFLCIYAANKQGMDWFNDEHWKTVAANLALATRAAKAARAKGICFDMEPYGVNPWSYPGRNTDKSFAEVAAKVRQRGAQFMEAMQKEMPDIHVMTFFLISHWREGRRVHLALLDEPNRERRLQQLSRGYYAVMPAFLNGMLKVANPRVRFTDGNESPSYYSRDSRAYFRGYHRMRNNALSLIDAENHERYRTQVLVGHALYLDYLTGVRTRRPNLGIYVSPADRLKWVEHNIYWSLTTSDEYVWVYHEFMDWWGTMAGQVRHGGWMPPGVPEAVESARRKVREGLPLGFDSKDFIAKALDRKNRKRYPSPVNKNFKPPAE